MLLYLIHTYTLYIILYSPNISNHSPLSFPLFHHSSSLPIYLFPTLVHPDLSVNSKYTCRHLDILIYILSPPTFSSQLSRV